MRIKKTHTAKKDNGAIEWPNANGVEKKLERIIRTGKSAEKRRNLMRAGEIAYQLREILQTIHDLNNRSQTADKLNEC